MLKRNEQQTRKKCATERRSTSFEEITQTAAGSNGETKKEKNINNKQKE